MDRFWSKVTKTNTCWFWNASKNRKGYGQFRINRVLWIAHRFSFKLCGGILIPGLIIIMHKCDRPNCVNPKHLIQGTIKQNNSDRAQKNRSANTFGSNNPNSKLKDYQVIEIRKIRKETLLSYNKIAQQFKVDRTLIHLICTNKIWKNI